MAAGIGVERGGMTVSGFTWFRYPHLRWARGRGSTSFLYRHTLRAFLVAVAVMGAVVLVGGPANAAPAVTSMDGGSTGAKATCTTLVTSPASSATQDMEVTLTAMVTPATAAGNVQFKDSTKDLGTAALTNGTAELKMKFEVGPHSLTAVFTPTDSTAFKSSMSPAVSLTVTASAANGTASAAEGTASAANGTASAANGTASAANGTASGQTQKPVVQVQPLVPLVQVKDDDKEGLLGSLLDALL